MNELLSALVQLGILDNLTAQRINRNLSPAEAQAWAESMLIDAFTGGLDSQRARLLDLVGAANGRPTSAQLAQFWRAEDDAFFRSVQPALYEVAQDRAIVAAVTSGGDMWNVVNDAIIGWVDTYYTNADVELVGSVPNLNMTGRTEFGRAFIDWQRGELETAGYADGLPQLIRAIEPTFGRVRAERVAVTESTRIFAEATRQADNANPYIVAHRIYTVGDERVCGICGPLHGMVIPKTQRNAPHPSLGAIAGPPFHVNCRCAIISETTATLQTALPPEETWQYTGPLPERRPSP